MTSYLNTLRLFSREARLYLVTAGLIGFTIFGGIYTTLLNLYLLRLGYGPEFIGLVNAVGLFGLAIFSLPAGMLGDRWGVRRMMILIHRGSLPVLASWHLEIDKLQYLGDEC